MLDFQIPRITSESVEENRGTFTIEPLDRGFGYTFGNSGKNVLNGPGGVTSDFSIRKLFTITERTSLEFRSEFFNAFNHAVFVQPDNYIDDGPGAAGVITSTVIPQRQIQFAMKLRF